MKEISVSSLFDLNNTIAGELFEGKENAYEVLPLIHDFILKLGETLPKEKFEKKGENIWIAKSAKVAETASITGPAIIDEEAEVRHCAFIRGNAIVGEKCSSGKLHGVKKCSAF